MDAVSDYLVKRGDDLVLLFTPPFDASVPDPGYIQGYLPGVRENGAQYTHAAAWCVMAYAMLGDGDRAFELFSILNPINHAATRGGAHRYKIEPYVVAGDVYSEPPHVGRGGWSWYTGAAGWLYRAGLEHVDGVMLGRAAYHDPYLLADVDRRLFGESARPCSRAAIVEALMPYAAAQIARGVSLRAITRHVLGLYHGVHGGRRFRQMLSDATQLRAEDPSLLVAALRAVE
jgi:hypothetical protein